MPHVAAAPCAIRKVRLMGESADPPTIGCFGNLGIRSTIRPFAITASVRARGLDSLFTGIWGTNSERRLPSEFLKSPRCAWTPRLRTDRQWGSAVFLFRQDGVIPSALFAV